MGLDYRPRPPLVELDSLSNYELYSLAVQERKRGAMLHIQEDTILRQGSAELEAARDDLRGIIFHGGTFTP